MSLSAQQLQDLIEAGIPAEHLPAIAKIFAQGIEQQEKLLAEKRERDRARQAEYRATKKMSQLVTVTSCDNVRHDVTTPNRFPDLPLTSKEIGKPPKGDSPTKKSLKKFELPDWLIPHQEHWDDWLEVRKAKRAPPTASALMEAVQELQRLSMEGHPPDLVLRQSILRGYTGIFALKADFSKGNNTNGTKQPTKDDRAKAAIMRGLASYEASLSSG